VTRNVLRRPAGSAQPAFYARTGNRWGDLLALLHPPYTAWHLSYVAYGAALAPELDLERLGGTVAAFFLGTGVAAHALDEWHSRPLGTRLPGRILLALGVGGLAASVAVAVAGAFVVSPWTLAWAAAGVFLAVGYVLEWHRLLHADLTFGLAWGGFPVLVGYWAQTEQVGVAALLVALAATLLSLAQRALSTPARHVRRATFEASALLESSTGTARWSRELLLATWEWPLKLLTAAAVTLAAGLLAMRW
jgi:hypothetical protein